jgi:hypothetical protein
MGTEIRFSQLAQQIRAFIRDEVREVLQECKAPVFSRISLLDENKELRRWLRPTDRHKGQIVRVTNSLGMNPAFLPQAKLLDVSGPEFQFPFLCEDASGNHAGYPHAWVEIVEEPAPEEPTPEPWKPKATDWVKITKPLNTAEHPGWPSPMDSLDGKVIQLVPKPMNSDLFQAEVRDGLWVYLNDSWLSPAEPPAPAPEPIEVTPVPEHPEPVEVVAQIPGPTNTIYLRAGKAYRLVNSEDIGKEVRVSDRSLEDALERDPDYLDDIEEDEPYPYVTDENLSWKLAFIEDPSLLEPKPEPQPVAIFMGPGETVTHYSDGTTTEEALDKVEKALDALPGAPEVEEPKQPEAPKYRYLEAEEIIQEGDHLNSSQNKSSLDVNHELSNGWMEAPEFYHGKLASFAFPELVVRRAIDPKPQVSELACEPEPEAAPEPDSDLDEWMKEPEWVTPGPEHIGQMVEVTDYENSEEWIPRKLVGIVPPSIVATHRFLAPATGQPEGCLCPWKYARIRKGS